MIFISKNYFFYENFFPLMSSLKFMTKRKKVFVILVKGFPKFAFFDVFI